MRESPPVRSGELLQGFPELGAEARAVEARGVGEEGGGVEALLDPLEALERRREGFGARPKAARQTRETL